MTTFITNITILRYDITVEAEPSSMDITQLDVFRRKTGNPGYRRAHYMNPGAHVMDKISHPSLTHGLIYLIIIKEMYSSMHRIIAKEHYGC